MASPSTPVWPAIATVAPSTGRQAERLNLNVTGQFTHFVDGTTIANVGAGITVNAVTVTNASQRDARRDGPPGRGARRAHGRPDDRR